ncbi:MAG: sigma-70 family RNA polymerase sigma factor [Planctomycetes bacterium]|nr:sigma-70 family RNA polymerase sigma factor [Planctomycetota bacterium]
MDDIERLLATHAQAVLRSLHIAPLWRASFDADDIMQVTYLEAFLAADRLRNCTPDEFAAWLRRRAEQNLRDAIRGLERAKRPNPSRRVSTDAEESQALLLEELVTTGDTASRAFAGREARQLLSRALDRLPESYRRTVELYDLEGRSIAEVADALGRSTGAIYMLRARAHDRLREILGSATGFL